jgi:hypothetical protein
MTGHEPAILWPAPGFPAFLNHSAQDIDAIIAADDAAAGAAAQWARGLALRPTGGGAAIPLVAESPLPVERDAVAPYVGDLLALTSTPRRRLFRVRLRSSRTPTIPLGRTVQLFDLALGADVLRSRSVAFFRSPGNCLNLAFVSDLHVAQMWDQIGAAVDRHFPQAACDLVRPHRLLERFIAEANGLVARGELDLVVLGGDLVDHVYPGRRHPGGANGNPSNVQRLVEMLSPLEAPTLAIPGNHDFRGYPWRPSLYGLGVVGLSREQNASLLREAGLGDGWPLARQDLDALRTTDAAGRPAIAEHLAHVNPTLNFTCTLHGVRLALLSSGRDALPQWRQMERSRWTMLARGLRWVWQDPDSEGFEERQLRQLGDWLHGGSGAAVFFHAPLFASEGAAVHDRVSRLHVGPQEALGQRVRFERRLQAAGVRRGVSLRNAGALLRTLREARAPIAAFSGHLHAATGVHWQPDAQTLEAVDLERTCCADGPIRLFTGPALGQIKPPAGRQPGYLLVRFIDGKLACLEKRALNGRSEG